MRSLLWSFVAVCAALAIAPANAATPVSFTPVLPSLNPSGVLYYKDNLVVTSVWDTTPAAGKAQLRIVDPTGKQSLVSSGTCPGTPPVCTTTFSMTATPNAAINADLNFTYSTSLLPKTWCFLANGVCVDPSLATASTSFSLVYSVSLQSVTMFSNNALPGVAVTGNSVSVRYTFNTPMATAGLNCTINGFVAFKVVSRYTVTCTRTVSNSDLNGQPSKVLTFWGSTAQFMSTGTVPCTLGLCADTPLITATSDNSAVTQYAPMQTTSVTMISNNADTAKAEVGDTITVTFAFNQFTSSTVLPDCKINGFQATVTSDSKSYICSRQITAADLNGQQTASATFAMVSSSIQSAAGLGCTAGLCTSQSITTLSAGSRVTMYAPNPLSLTAVSISSNNVDHAKAQVGDTITLTLSFNQAVASASGCSIMGAAVPAVISGSTVACSHTVTSSDVSGLASFAVVSNSFTVANGQACTAGLCTSPTVSATTDGSAVVVSVCSSGANVGNYVLSNVSTGKQACLSQCS